MYDQPLADGIQLRWSCPGVLVSIIVLSLNGVEGDQAGGHHIRGGWFGASEVRATSQLSSSYDGSMDVRPWFYPLYVLGQPPEADAAELEEEITHVFHKHQRIFLATPPCGRPCDVSPASPCYSSHCECMVSSLEWPPCGP